uniref:hypothetical protein n=1 Tax=Mycobacterium sp. TaxID=1785 RepID=UPI0031DD7496
MAAPCLPSTYPRGTDAYPRSAQRETSKRAYRYAHGCGCRDGCRGGGGDPGTQDPAQPDDHDR